ncbi:hypothetical protein [Pelolinea submarina]|uniref:Uncharacterized protein n=1 Tax=Pelolinea submarina TaxID=913107 RepID=A0A347ZSK7_9CHLR|nr:hypothetical protein [Pelolinea submarina]REG11145.1 hypothetical protein DFR64_1022 [Pelolinea submarina]BBB48288.1 hypothetical protein Pelsub_P1516 [Pelolinea submarina]
MRKNKNKIKNAILFFQKIAYFLKKETDYEAESIKDNLVLDFSVLSELYQKGIDGGFRQDIVEMAIEAYEIYKDKDRLWRTPIILSGEALHRLLFEVILQYININGNFPFNKTKKVSLTKEDFSSYKAAQILNDENCLSLNTSINSLYKLGLIDEITYYDMHALRNLRNKAVHGLIMPFLSEEKYKKILSTSDIHELVRLNFENNPKDLLFENYQKYQNYKFRILTEKGKDLYVIEQDRLKIDIENIPSEKRLSAISISLLFAIIKYINSKLPISKTD